MTDVLAKPELKVVGTRPVRPDGVDKVTGRAQYGADLVLPGMLVGKIKRSPHAHARIVSIDTRRARALPGVKSVITAADLQGVKMITPMLHKFSYRPIGQPILADEVVR